MRGELTYTIVTFGGHLGRHLEKYATDVIDLYIFILYDLHYIWIKTLFVSVYERKAYIHDCNFWWPSWPPSWKICNRSWWFLHILTLRPSLYMNRHIICFCIQKESWDTLDCNFWRPSWPPSWKICNWLLLIFTYSYSTTFTLYESTLYSTLYLKGELRYIWFGISAAMLAAILEKNFTYFQIPDHIYDIPVKFGWNILNSSEVITISFWGSKKTPKWLSCDFFRIWPTRVK